MPFLNQEVLYATDTLAARVSESARFFKQTLSNTVSNDERESPGFLFYRLCRIFFNITMLKLKHLQYNMIMAVLLTMRTKKHIFILLHYNK